MNANELKAATALEQTGDVVLKMTATGNPDFIVIPKALAARVRFVEVKAGRDKVQPHQQTVHENLRAEGFLVDVLKVEELDKLDEDERCACGQPLCAGCGLCESCDDASPCDCERERILEEEIDKLTDELDELREKNGNLGLSRNAVERERAVIIPNYGRRMADKRATAECADATARRAAALLK